MTASFIAIFCKCRNTITWILIHFSPQGDQTLLITLGQTKWLKGDSNSRLTALRINALTYWALLRRFILYTCSETSTSQCKSIIFCNMNFVLFKLRYQSHSIVFGTRLATRECCYLAAFCLTLVINLFIRVSTCSLISFISYWKTCIIQGFYAINLSNIMFICSFILTRL